MLKLSTDAFNFHKQFFLSPQAFIRTVAHRVSFLEEKVPEAKKSWCLFNTTFQLFRYAVIPSLKTWVFLQLLSADEEDEEEG